MKSPDDQEKYIEYLERRLKKLSEEPIGNKDLDTLIDTQNEIIINNSYNIKKLFNGNLKKQLESQQRSLEISDKYIDYLTNSFWWKISSPFRRISRKIKKNTKPKKFDFSKIVTITEAINVTIFISELGDELPIQIENIRNQKGLKKINILLLDLTNSPEIAKIAEKHKVNYINSLALDNDILQTKNLLTTKAPYIANIGQNVIIEDELWLYKMVRPIVENYSQLSILYSKNLPQIKNIENGTYFNELRARIFEIGHFDCLLLPNNRNNIQYIPPSIIDEASAIVKQRNRK